MFVPQRSAPLAALFTHATRGAGVRATGNAIAGQSSLNVGVQSSDQCSNVLKDLIERYYFLIYLDLNYIHFLFFFSHTSTHTIERCGKALPEDRPDISTLRRHEFFDNELSPERLARLRELIESATSSNRNPMFY